MWEEIPEEMNMQQNHRTTQAIAALAGCALTAAATAQVLNADPTKIGGDFIAGSGIPADNFMGTVDAVSTFFKARGRDSGQAVAIHGNTYIVLDGPSTSNAGASWWSFDFQFTPNMADLVTGPNYNLTLQLDLDPTEFVNFRTLSMPIFDADADPANSWDDGDGHFVNPGAGSWSDDNIDYVYSQSWRMDFGFLNGSFLPAGDYDMLWRATPTAGPIASRTTSTYAHVRVIPAASAALTLDAVDDCLDGSQTQVVVEVNLSNAQDTIVGGQFFLSYDTANLTFVSADPGDAPFTSEVFELVDTGPGEITYAVGIPSGAGTTAATTMARLTFNVNGDFCFVDDMVSFRTGVLPTRITDSNGADIQPTLVNTHWITRDSVAPTVTAPPDITVFSDAGLCTATIDNVENFENPIATGPSQAPGVWYTDRFNPDAFESAFFDGDDRLHIGISGDDRDGNRGAFDGIFYNTQGRKYDVDIPVGHKWSGKLYIGSDWTTTVKRSDIWATTFDSFGGISGFPILGFVSNDPADGLNPNPTSPDPRFRWFTQDTDQDPSNGFTPDWIDLGLPTGFSYDRWWTLEIELTDGAFIAHVIDDNGVVVLSFTDVLTFGSVRAGNLIMQAYNFGTNAFPIDYDVYWDDIIIGPAGAVATDDCSDLDITFERSDDANLSLADPFPVGTTTVTWTAVDDCGNTTSDTQLITVSGNTILDVAVELQATVDSGPFDRCITFELIPTGGGAPIVVSETMTFTGGIATAAVEVPCGDYECIMARDTLHTLRKTDSDDFAIAGPNYTADFTVAGGGDALIGGNLNDDDFIDILDFGIFIGQFGSTPGADTACGFVGPHADITGDGTVGSGDFTFIQINFLEFSEAPCTGAPLLDGGNNFAGNGNTLRRDRPVISISVDDLIAMGMADLAQGDLNHDGMLDESDVAAFMGGMRPDHIADIDRSGTVDFYDLQSLMDHMGQQVEMPYDMNGDGVITLDDLQFVIQRIGMNF
jgi:cohesin domain-containing protein